VDAETSVNADASIMGLPKMRVLNVATVGQTQIKCSAVSSSNWQDAQSGLVVSAINHNHFSIGDQYIFI
jgi:hypothetical protein